MVTTFRRHLWCDGRCDCDTCDDEAGCGTWRCGEDRFRCHVSGLCLDPRRVCDGHADCGEDDRSDEHDCPCDHRPQHKE